MWLEPGILISWRWNFLPQRPQEMTSFLPPSHSRWMDIQSQCYSWGSSQPDGTPVRTSKPCLHCTGLWAILVSASTQLPDLNSFWFKALGLSNFSFAFECGSTFHILVRSPVSCVWSFVEDSFHVSSVRLTGRHSPSLCHAPAIMGLVALK